MAYAAVASLSHTIHILLNYHQSSMSHEFKDGIISIQKHAIFLESFIEDSPDRANNWEETIREVTERAEDIIELLLSDSLLESSVGSSKPKLGKGRYELHYDFDELEKVREEMESITERVKGKHTEAVGGSDEEVMEIVNRLVEGSSALEIIAIVGAAGIGKTTLVKRVLENPLIEEHFDNRTGYTVSQEYSLRRFLLHMLLFINKWDDEIISKSESELIQSVHKYFYSKGYLIILDDVWTQEALHSLKSVLPDNCNGSRIIITTRSAELAQAADYIHEMRFLDEDRSWDMLRQKIFKGDPCPSQLESIGKRISRTCRGHPLSIQVISGILAADQTEAAWEDILENISIAASVDSDDDLVLNILSLSYTYLPHHLRSCFLYFGNFSADEELHVSKLVKLWVAEGILIDSGSKSFEETGEEHVEDLVQRGLFSVVDKKCNGRIRSIGIHDLMLDVCQRQARLDGFILCVDRFHSFDDRLALATELKSCRCVSTFTYGDEVLEAIHGSTIRTIILRLDEGQVGTRLPIGNVRLLRILDLSNAHHYDLPAEVFELFHLRYLAFCGFSISKAISNLENLQTLIILPRRKLGEFGRLPVGIWWMRQLRHLSVLGFKLPNQEGATVSLEDMQTLCGVVDFTCSVENLRMIPNLKKLSVFFSNKSRDMVQDYELHNLIHLQQLKTLKIEMRSFPKKQNGISYAFPPTLNKLELCGLQLQWEDMEIVASLPNLQVLKLRRHFFMGEMWETSEGGFSELTYLLIEDSNLRKWTTRSSHFYKLKSLVLYLCPHLFEVPIDIGIIPTLELIEMDFDNYNLRCSAKRIQEYRQNFGDDRLKIRMV